MKKGVSFKNGKAKTGSNNIFRQFGKWMIVGICVILFAAFLMFSGFKEGAINRVTTFNKSGATAPSPPPPPPPPPISPPLPPPPSPSPSPSTSLLYLNEPNVFKSIRGGTNPFQNAFPLVWTVFTTCYKDKGRNEGNSWAGNINSYNNQLGNAGNIYPLIFARADGIKMPKLVPTDGVNPTISDMEKFENDLKTNTDKSGKNTKLSLNGVAQSNLAFKDISLYDAFAKLLTEGPVAH